jgi:hypothetical protein
MTRSPALSRALREHGFANAARELDAAKDAITEMLALRLALATIDGAAHALRVHARALRNTSAAHERGCLRGLEDDLVRRLGDLLRRERITSERAGATSALEIDE